MTVEHKLPQSSLLLPPKAQWFWEWEQTLESGWCFTDSVFSHPLSLRELRVERSWSAPRVTWPKTKGTRGRGIRVHWCLDAEASSSQQTSARKCGYSFLSSYYAPGTGLKCSVYIGILFNLTTTQPEKGVFSSSFYRGGKERLK